jgi:hypothetical protein
VLADQVRRPDNDETGLVGGEIFGDSPSPEALSRKDPPLLSRNSPPSSPAAVG